MKIRQHLISIIVLLFASLLLTNAKLTLKSPTKPSHIMAAKVVAENKQSPAIPKSLKLIFGAGGIYAAFLYYGTLQEDVFHYTASDGTMFKAAWFLQALGEHEYWVSIIAT